MMAIFFRVVQWAKGKLAMTGSGSSDETEFHARARENVPEIDLKEIDSIAKKAVRKAVKILLHRVVLAVGFVAALMTILGVEGVSNFIDNLDARIGATVREEIETMRAETQFLARRYEIEIPREQGRFLWRTDVETAEYRSAVIAGSYIYGLECDISTVDEEIYMHRSGREWNLIVNKTSGCDRLRVDVVYVPSIWMDDVSFGESGEALERTLDR